MDGTKPPFSRANVRPVLRSRSRGGLLIAVATASVAAGLTLAYKSRAISENERAQRMYKAPNGYVSVDRSGGGI